MSATEPSPAPPPTRIQGQLVQVRTISRRLAFADVMACDGGTIEVVVKTWDLPEAFPTVRAALRHCKLGDTIAFDGFFEEQGETERLDRYHRVFKSSAPPRVVEAWTGDPFKPVLVLCQPVSSPAPVMGTVRNELCKYYTNTKKCPRSPRCPYLHTDDKALRRAWFEGKRESALRQEREVVGCPSPRIASTNAAARKSKRAGVFADFLCERFDLNPESLVLDVAGGRGDLCFHLTAIRGIPCVSVDPRGRKLNKEQRKFLKKRRKEEGREDIGQELWGKHISQLFHSDFFDDGDGERELLFGRVSLIVGLHPDEATECIVDCALAKGIPFAISPCCVFALDKRTMSFQDWCDYLEGKDPRIKRGHMDVEGKNLVLYLGEE